MILYGSLSKRRSWSVCVNRFTRGSHSHNEHSHGHAVENETTSHLFETNKLLAEYAQRKRMADARSVFDAMQKRNVVSWTVMILGYANNEESELALELYEHMDREGVLASDRTFVAALKACSNLAPVGVGNRNATKPVQKDVLRIGRTIHSQVVKVDSGSNIFVCTALVYMYAKYDCMEDAWYVFITTPNHTVVLWNAILTVYAKKKDACAVLDLYAQLRQECITPDDGTYVSTLKACSALAAQEDKKDIALENGRSLHQEIVKCGYESYMFVGTSLVDMYAKCMKMEDAQITFENSPKRDVVSWNAMIWGYANKQEVGQALRLYTQMQQESFLANEETFLGIFKTCSAPGTCKEHAHPTCRLAHQDTGRNVHSAGVKRGLDFDGVVGTSLVDMYAKWGSLRDAQHCFDNLSHCDVVAWTPMILGYANNYKGPLALKLYSTMQQKDVVPDDQTFVAALKACCALVVDEKDGHSAMIRCIENGRTVHGQVIEGRFENGTLIRKALLEFYTNCGSMDDAKSVFNNWPHYDVVSWNSMILGYAKEDEGDLALELYAIMLQSDVPVNSQTFVAALKACSTLASSEIERLVDGTLSQALCLMRGQIIHSHVVECGAELDSYVGNSLVVMYATCGHMDDARNMYNQLPYYDVVSCTAMISGYVEEGSNDKAFELYAEMQKQGLPRDELAFVSILKACCQASFLGLGEELHTQICELGFESGAIVATTLLVAYTKCGNMVDAQFLFDALTARSLVIWNTLIAGYACQGDTHFTFTLLCRMKQEGILPDGGTLLNVLKLCSYTGLVRESLALCGQYLVTPTLEHFTCIIDLFGRAGLIDNVTTIIENMPFQPDVVAWVNVLGICQQWNLLDFGKHAFDNVVSLSEKHAAAYVLMSNVYACANMC